MSEADLTIKLGVEEEFFLVDPETRDLESDPAPGIFEACERGSGPHTIAHEVLRTQIESSTKACGSVAEAREAVRETRRLVVESAGQHGVAVMAASSHPFAEWRSQLITPKERYERFAVTFQDSVRQLLVGGMHIHAGFGDPDSRIRVMTALRRYLPLLHALSASSPFRAGRETGFKSYRLTIMGALPRTNLPGPLSSWADYDRLVAAYQRMNFIQNGSELWWDIRPSHRFPTVEMRICDVCPRLDDVAGIVALYASLVRRLLRLDSQGLLPPDPPTEIIAENRWLAQRYGVLAFLGDARGRRTRGTSGYARGSSISGGRCLSSAAAGAAPRAHHHSGRQRRRPADRPLPPPPAGGRHRGGGAAGRGRPGGRGNAGRNRGRWIALRQHRGGRRAAPCSSRTSTAWRWS